MNTLTKRQTGTSFLPHYKQWYLKPKETPVSIKIGELLAETAAQAMTIIGYGDGHNKALPFRSLDYKVKCEDYHDWAKCIEIIGGYNEFDSATILKAAFWRLNLSHFLNDGNGNNGKSLFDFHIAREGSPAFYVQWNEKYGSRIIKDTEHIEPNEGQEAGTMLFWEEYTAEDFKNSMKALKGEILADEFDMEEQDYYGDNTKVYTARFWFD